jgi:N-methylhydantoinase A/oxoprolinase/acetone carboxylase beta subunit
MRRNVQKGTTKQTNKVARRKTSAISLVSSANRRDTIQIYAQRKVLKDFSELG